MGGCFGIDGSVYSAKLPYRISTFFKKFRVVGGGGVPSEFSVLLWSKALVLDLDQAEQKKT